MPSKPKKMQRMFILYWFLLGYIIAALIFWFLTLNNQNMQMSILRKTNLSASAAADKTALQKIENDEQRKIKQYAGEGATFFLVIMAGAIFFYRSVKRQLKISQEQQNFMMAVTHELKTPIAVAKLNLETIQKRKLDDAQQSRLLHNTLMETNRLDDLCNNMLISSQIEAGGYGLVKEEIDLGKLVNNCAGDFVARYPQRIMEKNIEKDIFITGDYMLLQIAINNLLDNALKYSPRDLPVGIQLQQKSTTAQIQVSDNGRGIADADKKKVFEKFYRLGNEATKTARGTGLGLYLARKIIINHGGKIFIQNNIPDGSIFTIELNMIV